MFRYIRNTFYKFRIRRIKKEYLFNNKIKRAYLRKIIDIIRIEDLIPIKNKYIKINTYHTDILTYINFVEDLLSNNKLSKSILNNRYKKIYYIDFFVHSNVMLDNEKYMKMFIETYKRLYEILSNYDYTASNVMFFNFKILNLYLVNMEEILVDVISRKLL